MFLCSRQLTEMSATIFNLKIFVIIFLQLMDLFFRIRLIFFSFVAFVSNWKWLCVPDYKINGCS